MNFREVLLKHGVAAAAMFAPGNFFHALEIGCMYRENEGLSTYHLAEFMEGRPGDSKLVSIEYDPEHVDAARAIFEARDPSLLRHVDFRTGHSLQRLSEALSDISPLQFAFLDGGAHPEVCLQELEIILDSMSENGLILIDNLQEIGLSPAYPHPRIFGKGTLILPALMMAKYLQVREVLRDRNSQFCDEGEGIPSSEIVDELQSSPHLKKLAQFDFTLFEQDKHRILAVGRSNVLNILETSLAHANPTIKAVPPTASWNTMTIPDDVVSIVDTASEEAPPIQKRHPIRSNRVAAYCPETCIVFVSYGRREIAAASYESLSAAIAPYRDRIRIVIAEATDDPAKMEWARNTDADDLILTPRFTPAATSRNLAVSLIQDKYTSKFLCLLEDDFGYNDAWYPSLVEASRKLYGAISPLDLAYGIFSACDHHVPDERIQVDQANNVIAYYFGAIVYQRFMPAIHYRNVLREWDPDLLGVSYAQTGLQTFRNTIRGFCGAILPGQLSWPIDVDSESSTWSKGKRDPGPPAHSFDLNDYQAIRASVRKAGGYHRE